MTAATDVPVPVHVAELTGTALETGRTLADSAHELAVAVLSGDTSRLTELALQVQTESREVIGATMEARLAALLHAERQVGT